MKILRALLFTLFTAFVVYALNNKLSEIPFLKDHIPESLASAPPLGKFIDPFKGFWTNATSKNISKQVDLNVKGLKEKVEVLFDDRLVPHIFAKNDDDLYFAQGYITAQNRLWQMEFQTHAAAGRLSEIVGEKALDYDLFQRKVGMGFAAENALAAMLANETSKKTLENYTAGVNAYIQSLKPQDYPIEYKLLDYAPEAWTNIKTAYMLKIMAFDLSAGGSDDLPLTELLSRYDKKTVSELFPSYFDRTMPVIPSGTKLDFKPVKVPKIPADLDSTLLQIAKNITTSKLLDKNNEKTTEKPEKGSKGSNNWAVSAKKSATGFPILANDPHLKLTLPSIWYEIQLVSPTTNVYGVSLPGTPCVTIGFNQNISWGITNTYADVLDIYQLKTKDNKFDEYFFEGEWKKTTSRNEIIKIRGAKEITQIVHYTHHGAIVFEKKGENFNLDIPVAHALRWTAYDTSNELLALYKVNRANKYEEFVEGLSTFKCPASNFAYADKDKNIAMNVTGAMPLRWKEQGKYVLDGSKASHDWAAMLEQAHYPHILNPEQGFVSSANQFSTDTTSYPYYLNWDYISPERAIRINEQLTASGKMNADDMRKLQNDYLNILARDILPKMLAKTNLNSNEKSKENSYQKAYDALSKWNLQNSPESVGATIFEMWWLNFNNSIWADDMKDLRFPAADKTVLLVVKDTNSRWYDDVKTPEKENMEIILTKSFKKTIDELQKQHGELSDNWRWGKHRGTDIGHIARISGFGKKNIPTGGGGRIVNATTKTNGPSWRMVVQLGDNPKGFGIYPGGQSGNPGSYFYDDMVEKWRLGELSELLFIKKPDFNSPRILGRVNIN